MRGKLLSQGQVNNQIIEWTSRKAEPLSTQCIRRDGCIQIILRKWSLSLLDSAAWGCHSVLKPESKDYVIVHKASFPWAQVNLHVSKTTEYIFRLSVYGKSVWFLDSTAQTRANKLDFLVFSRHHRDGISNRAGDNLLKVIWVLVANVCGHTVPCTQSAYLALCWRQVTEHAFVRSSPDLITFPWQMEFHPGRNLQKWGNQNGGWWQVDI